MADFEVTLPPLGEDGVEAVKVSFWYAEQGERVETGDDLLQVLTDKVTFDVPSPESGTVKAHQVAEGDEVRVGQVICILETSE